MLFFFVCVCVSVRVRVLAGSSRYIMGSESLGCVRLIHTAQILSVSCHLLPLCFSFLLLTTMTANQIYYPQGFFFCLF